MSVMTSSEKNLDLSEPKHILAINDDAAILQLFKDILTDEGYRVTVDSFSRQTVDLQTTLRDVNPDLILLDFIIGGEDKGWQLLQVTQMDRNLKDTPVVICTGAVNQVNQLSSQFESLGVQVVIKPFDIDNLLQAIERAFNS